MQSLFQKGKEFGKNHHRVFLQTDILIIGGGIIGMNIARVLS